MCREHPGPHGLRVAPRSDGGQSGGCRGRNRGGTTRSRPDLLSRFEDPASVQAQPRGRVGPLSGHNHPPLSRCQSLVLAGGTPQTSPARPRPPPPPLDKTPFVSSSTVCQKITIFLYYYKKSQASPPAPSQLQSQSSWPGGPGGGLHCGGAPHTCPSPGASPGTSSVPSARKHPTEGAQPARMKTASHPPSSVGPETPLPSSPRGVHTETAATIFLQTRLFKGRTALPSLHTPPLPLLSRLWALAQHRGHAAGGWGAAAI